MSVGASGFDKSIDDDSVEKDLISARGLADACASIKAKEARTLDESILAVLKMRFGELVK
jgi:hypothetical protein